jgi:radical SAM protein with 4Fe4S-binding SPASM domain
MIVAGRPPTYRDLDRCRSRNPYVFNIETTNACNMTCEMCPRTKMTRRIQHMDVELFQRVIDQVRVQPEQRLNDFTRYVAQAYPDVVKNGAANEDGFYFFISSRHLTLHGYGEPMLDPYIADRVRYCTDKGVPTYFSTVPVNAKTDKVERVLRGGLGVLKFSMDASNCNGSGFNSYNIIKAINRADVWGTRIVLAKLEKGDETDAEWLREWKLTAPESFPYIKSMDNRWHTDKQAPPNRSHYVKQYCEYPWSSLTVMSNGDVVPCPQDYDCEMVMGNAAEQSLEEIWNGERYAALRRAHVDGSGGYKCFGRCDQRVVADWREG